MRIHEFIGRRAREHGDRTNLGVSLGRQASIHLRLVEPDQAMRLLAEQERVYRELGDVAGLGFALNNHAVCLLEVGRPEEAIPFIEEAIEIAAQLGSSAFEGRQELRAAILAAIGESEAT